MERLACMAQARGKFIEAQKIQPNGETGRADVALAVINKLYSIDRSATNSASSVVRSVACRSSAS